MYKKISKLLVVVTLINTLAFQPVSAETLIHEATTNYEITRGVYRQNIKRFTSNGWYNINVIKADLTDSNVKLDTLFNKDGISIRKTTLASATESSAVAAINADYFSPKPGTNLAHSVGPLIQNSKVISTPVDAENTDIFATFSLDKNNKPDYTYWTKDIKLIAPNGSSMPIQDINKFGWFEFLYMYDKNWGPKTLGISDTFPSITQLVVVNNKVKAINTLGKPIDIPKNGFVIEGDYKAGDFLKNNFKIGDSVKVDIKTTPNLSNLKMAVGGGSIIVKDGQVPKKFSLYKPERAPQTSIGTTRDGKQIILTTVDGRQAASRGMTPTELAALMIELGAYNALQLDSGGSTTMVSKDLGHNELEIANKYSDPNPRPVTNSIGVFTTAPKGTLKGIKIETDDANIFANTARAFTIVGYDQYYNPIIINQKSVKWSSQGVLGTFSDNYFTPSSTGNGKVIAKVNGINSSIDIKVLSSPVKLEVYPKNFPISDNPQWLGVEGFDKDGYSAFINTRNLNIDTDDIITVTDNFIRNTSGKSGVVKVSLGNVYTYFGISSPNQNTQLDGFEQNNNIFWGYPNTVSGKFSLTQEFVTEGKYSGRLDFDFSNTSGTKGAYITFGQNGYAIKSKPSKLAVSVYTESQYPQSIKGEFSDSTGKVFRTTFSSSINWTEWKDLTTTIPNNIVYPVKLNKLYVVDSNPDIKNKGVIYFDDLKAIYNNTSILKLPPSKTLPDYQNTNSLLKGGENSYRIAAYGDILKPSNPLGSDLLNKITSTINQKSSFGAFAGNISIESLNNLKVPYAADTNKFGETDYKNSKFITISARNNANNSIRLKDASQWNSLFNTLKNNNKDNVFILIDSPINGDYGFIDNLEGDLFKKTLSDYVSSSKKNVWVLYSSKTIATSNENGVKYIGISGNSVGEDLSKTASDKQYLSITVNGKEVTYKFKKLSE